VSNKQQALWIGYFILAVSLMLVGPYFLPKISETLSYSQFKHARLTAELEEAGVPFKGETTTIGCPLPYPGSCRLSSSLLCGASYLTASAVRVEA